MNYQYVPRCDAARTLRSKPKLHLLDRTPSTLSLWFTYLPVYHQIRKNPRAWANMHNDPAVLKMRKISRIIGITFVVLWPFIHLAVMSNP